MIAIRKRSGVGKTRRRTSRSARSRSTAARASRTGNGAERGPIRYAVVGLGYIAQAAVLPAFKHAGKNSRLQALVSGDPQKLKQLGRKHKIDHLYSYEGYDELLRSGLVDAVYIALPNTLHAEYAIRAANAGVHVLCEKPMAVTEDECLRMLQAAKRNAVKLMIAYRLHFEEANLSAVELAQKGKLGEVRLFNSVFSNNVKRGNIRLQRELGGGTVYDIGIYCINAARYLFRAEPVEVVAFSVSRDDQRFEEVDEMTAAMLRFPNDRLATFISSFGASDVSSYRIVGTKGDLLVEPAFEFAGDLRHVLTINSKKRERTFKRRDQFAPLLLYFSQCILADREPEPSGEEGLIDVRIIDALYHSARIGQPVALNAFPPDQRPDLEQEIRRPPVREPKMVNAESPSA